MQPALDAARTVLLDLKLKREYDRLQKDRAQAQAQHRLPQLYEPMDPSQLEQVVMVAESVQTNTGKLFVVSHNCLCWRRASSLVCKGSPD